MDVQTKAGSRLKSALPTAAVRRSTGMSFPFCAGLSLQDSGPLSSEHQEPSHQWGVLTRSRSRAHGWDRVWPASWCWEGDGLPGRKWQRARGVSASGEGCVFTRILEANFHRVRLSPRPLTLLRVCVSQATAGCRAPPHTPAWWDPCQVHRPEGSEPGTHLSPEAGLMSLPWRRKPSPKPGSDPACERAFFPHLLAKTRQAAGRLMAGRPCPAVGRTPAV